MVQVTVSEGTLEGQIVENEYGGSYCSFKGIPYAEPPVGDLRFKAPEPPLPYEGIRSAKEFGNVCYQGTKNGGWRGSEDCLYLNVYTPSIEPHKPWPIMFWIHGGSFKEGSGNDYLFAPEFLVRHGVILVTFNYRLGPLGFLCLHTEDIPGNAAMKDQVAALRWVKRNIRSFGGNPDNITIFGNSAGAACVCLHVISPMTKNLFKRAIAISGCATNWWTYTYDPIEKAFALAESLGFRSKDVEELCKFFKELPVETLADVNLPSNIGNNASRTNIFNNIHFAVVSEQRFGYNEVYFEGNINDVRTYNIHKGVEVMIGYNADEGVIVVPKVNEYDELVDDINGNLELLIPTPLYKHCSINQHNEIGMKIKKYYFKNDRLTRESWEQLSKYFSMETFVYDIMQWIQFTCAEKMYLYKFSCISERNIMSTRHGLFSSTRNKEVVVHADELGYIFNAKVMDKVDKHSDVYRMIDNVTTLFTNFAKYGNPTPDTSLGVTWLPYKLNEQNYLDIGNQLTSKIEPDYEEIKFWNEIYRQYATKYIKMPEVWHTIPREERHIKERIL
ncbi:esterase B1 [Manduca sexta]|uniref:Carboxylic ester hydrolase n=1 Tax=Manduca sexta TaxID=7130 RepID=A0A977T704_MANSE|nr:esterase B1 [Manduca sexta]UXP71968.1 esterase [Manduca sexta]